MKEAPMDLFGDRDIANWKAQLVMYSRCTGEEADRVISEVRPVASAMASAFAIPPAEAVAHIQRETELAGQFLRALERGDFVGLEPDPRSRFRVAWDNFLYALEGTPPMSWIVRFRKPEDRA